MSAISAATSDETTTKTVSSSAAPTATSSYANIVQKDNGDKDKPTVKPTSAGDTAKKSASTNSAAVTNVPLSNINNKTDKSKVSGAHFQMSFSVHFRFIFLNFFLFEIFALFIYLILFVWIKEPIAQESNADNKSPGTTNDSNKDDNVIDAEDEASFTPVVSNSRKDRNSRRNKERGSTVNATNAAGGNNGNRQSQSSNKSQRQPRSENGRSKDATHKRSKGNNHRDDKDKSTAHSESAATTGTNVAKHIFDGYHDNCDIFVFQKKILKKRRKGLF